MRSACFEPYSYKRFFAVRCDSLPMGNGSVTLLTDRSQRFHRVGSVNRLIYRAEFFRFARNNCKIFLFRRFRNFSSTVLVQGADNYSRRTLIKPTDSSENRLLAFIF